MSLADVANEAEERCPLLSVVAQEVLLLPGPWAPELFNFTPWEASRITRRFPPCASSTSTASEEIATLSPYLFEASSKVIFSMRPSRTSSSKCVRKKSMWSRAEA